LLTDYEWMSGDLFHYKVLRSGLTGQVAVQEPDLPRASIPLATPCCRSHPAPGEPCRP
jgi:hypothetical protein